MTRGRPRKDYVLPRKPAAPAVYVEPTLLVILGHFNTLRKCPSCGQKRVVYVAHHCPAGEVRALCKPCAEKSAAMAELGVYVRKVGSDTTPAVWAKDALPEPDPARIKRAIGMHLEKRVEAQAGRLDALED